MALSKKNFFGKGMLYIFDLCHRNPEIQKGRTI